MSPLRKDRVGEFRTALDKNKRIIFQTQQICGICGQPVDMSLKYPDPMSKTVDHIIPISRGGHPSDLSNLQLAHRWCNRQKSDKLFMPGIKNNRGLQSAQEIQDTTDGQTNPDKPQGRPITGKAQVDNNNLPQHADWANYQW